MTTKTPTVNAQIEGPLSHTPFDLAYLSIHADSGNPRYSRGRICEVDSMPTERRTREQIEATVSLLCRAYEAFDRAGRSLNVDATILAESIDVAALVCAARDAIALMRQLSDEQLAPVQAALDGLVCALDPIP